MSSGDLVPREDPVDAASARGDFDDLALAGKPLRLPARHDPDWWVKQRIDADDVDRDALLPVVVLLRREHDLRDETLAALLTEQDVRDYAEDYTRRVRDDRLRNPLARMLAPELDPDVAVERWQQLRASAGGPFDGEDGPQSEPAADGTGPSGTGMSAGTRRQWWPFGRRTL
ncbi:J-domain-containing protein [Brachybacterium muris]|uniref:DnaJ homologue subfamily C member 28 conserved domain-containing protein n=1 Tax=Brachybacterium muris UCD-AY4 TaxID=1249481 RepID=A0A022KUA1_9MICO|nr:DUF1992 domain-containing protein [Brachybacterium muris]EYT49719.1 hypothetical protein D641_0106755 [Brachybacterium muris UCD-AY4]